MGLTASPDLTVDIGGLTLKNPVMTASGTFGYAREFAPFMDLSRLGAIIVKGISLKPRPGNPPPRIVEIACGMLNAIGLENVGVERFIADKMPYLRRLDTPVIVNVLGETVEEYGEIARRLSGVPGVAALEVNISCPNVQKGGVAFGSDPAAAAKVTATAKKNCALPVMVKLSPNVTDIAAIAKAVEDAGADSISLINTLLAMAVDINSRRPKLANVMGGLSGPAIKPIAVRMVYQASRAVKIPVIGIGGVTTADDALEFIIAGASAVQLGTASFRDAAAAAKVLDGIDGWLRQQGIASVAGLIGSLRLD
ncbi:MAG: dihydroorotate dehydrogenase [Desulfobulbaceae bacterium]|jgi:dihydroorotate dehydrogenase (NAD+) catalytic subunit|nr:dihydroorotate dehydrogenase [Desulfobulbaceae bacterium]